MQDGTEREWKAHRAAEIRARAYQAVFHGKPRPYFSMPGEWEIYRVAEIEYKAMKDAQLKVPDGSGHRERTGGSSYSGKELLGVLVVVAVLVYWVVGAGKKTEQVPIPPATALSAAVTPFPVPSTHTSVASHAYKASSGTRAHAASRSVSVVPVDRHTADSINPERDAAVLARISPRYPPQAIRQRHEGTVTVLVDVGADGSVEGTTVATSSGYRELDMSAVEAVRHWQFRSAVHGGRAVAGEVRVPVNFALNVME